MFEPPPPASLQRPVRHYAGVLISIEPACLTEVRRTLDGTAGVEVHHVDPQSGRCVAVLESADRAAGERIFASLSCLPHVHSVDLVYHLVDPDPVDPDPDVTDVTAEAVLPESKP